MRQFGKYEYGLTVGCGYCITVDFHKRDNGLMITWENVLVLGRCKLKILRVRCHYMGSILLGDRAKEKGVYKYIEPYLRNCS